MLLLLLLLLLLAHGPHFRLPSSETPLLKRWPQDCAPRDAPGPLLYAKGHQNRIAGLEMMGSGGPAQLRPMENQEAAGFPLQK